MRVTESHHALGAVSSITAEQTTTARAGAVFALQLERDMQQIATLLSALARGVGMLWGNVVHRKDDCRRSCARHYRQLCGAAAGPLGASTVPCLLAGQPISAGLSVVKLTTKVALCRRAQPG
jgi:hypothetical protein